jgi:hypothetical protein
MTTITQDKIAVHPLTSFETEVVVDLGCCSYLRGERLEDSIQTLIKRFKPAILFGFDPHPALTEAVGQVYGTTVITSRKAAWMQSGRVSLTINGNCTHVTKPRLSGYKEEWAAECFDFAAWARTLPEANIVLKMDVEGAEYVLLPYLIEQGLMDRFSRLLIEWHTGEYANGYESDRAAILADIECPVEEWQ